MRGVNALIGVLAVVAVTVVWLSMGDKMSSDDSIEYQGESVKLSKSYDEYDDYKNDPNNLAPGEAARVQALVQSAPIAKQFSDRKQMISAVHDLKFPGYGLTSYAESPQPDGSVLQLMSVEIPQAGNDRYLLFRGIGGSYTLIDDFVHAESAIITDVSASGDKLVYSSPQGTTVVERPLSVK